MARFGLDASFLGPPREVCGTLEKVILPVAPVGKASTLCQGPYLLMTKVQMPIIDLDDTSLRDVPRWKTKACREFVAVWSMFHGLSNSALTTKTV